MGTIQQRYSSTDSTGSLVDRTENIDLEPADSLAVTAPINDPTCEVIYSRTADTPVDNSMEEELDDYMGDYSDSEDSSDDTWDTLKEFFSSVTGIVPSNTSCEKCSELDEMIDNIKAQMATSDLSEAKDLTSLTYQKLESMRTETSHSGLDYRYYYSLIAEIFQKTGQHDRAITSLYRGILFIPTDGILIPQVHMQNVAIYWTNLDEFSAQRGYQNSGRSIIMLKCMSLIRAMTQKYLEEKKRSEIAMQVYSDLLITYNGILQACPYSQEARTERMKTFLPFVQCFINLGLHEVASTLCKTGKFYRRHSAKKEYICSNELIGNPECPETSYILEKWATSLEMGGKIDIACKKLEEALSYAKEPDHVEELGRKQVLYRQNWQNSKKLETKTKDADKEWLPETAINALEMSRLRADNIKENHVKKKRRRPKARSSDNITNYLQLSWNKIEKSGKRCDSPLSFNRKKKRRRKNTAGSEISNASSCTNNDFEPSQEDITMSSDSDVNDFKLDIGFQPQYDPFSNVVILDSDEENETALRSTETIYDQNADQYKTGKEDISLKPQEEDILLNGFELSQSFVESKARKERYTFYEDSLPNDMLRQLLKKEPKRYKRGILRIEGAHNAICYLCEPEDELKEIEISGRSKCGKNFSGEEVVVEILRTPTTEKKNAIPRVRFHKELSSTNSSDDGKTFGKVIGRLHRKLFQGVEHPVFVCEMDQMEYHLMRPLCKSIPKIHVLHDKNQKFKIDCYEYDQESQTMVKESININPANRKSYVFLVVFIRWDLVYPTGMIVKVMRSDGSVNSALQVLGLQHQVPKNYKQNTIVDVKALIRDMPEEPNQELVNDREDLTGSLSVFTIDPPGSKDLDDALSFEKLEHGLKIGVHIADVTSYIKKDSAVDTEAKYRATTVYPGHGINPFHMLPEPLSTNLCSLLPNKKRLALSVFFVMNEDGVQIKQPDMKKTVVMSRRRFTYCEVQDIIFERNLDTDLSEDILNLFNLAKKMRRHRLGEGIHAFPTDVDLLNTANMDDLQNCPEAHYLVEEFMILTNHEVGKIVSSTFPKEVVLRCQDAPPASKVCDWLKSYPRIADIVLKLQGKKTQANRKVGVQYAPVLLNRVFLKFQKWVWDNLQNAVMSKNFRDAWKLIGSDELHPEQALAWNEWISFQEHAEYRCQGATKDRRQKYHFSLGIHPYTHFTSPIRRYADILVHRMVHAGLDKKKCPYSLDDIVEICCHINEVSRRAKLFQKQCASAQSGQKLKNNQVLLNAFVENVSDKVIALFIPGFKSLPKTSREIQLNKLNVSQRPKVKRQVDEDRPFDFVTLFWKRRLYSQSQTEYAPSTIGKKEIRIDPHQQVSFQQYTRWIEILQCLSRADSKQLTRCVDRLGGDYLPGNRLRSCEPTCTDTVADVSSEVRVGPIIKQHCEFSMSFNHDQIVRVQLNAETEKGLLVPSPQVLDLTKNLKICLQHARDPVKYLSAYATQKAKKSREGNSYENVADYLKIWLPLLEMESVITAANEDPIVINDLPIKFEGNGGTFTLTNDFCYGRNIEFNSASMDYIFEGEDNDNDDNEDKHVPVADYICIKAVVDSNERSMYGPWKGAPGEKKIWVAHGKIDLIIKRKKKEKEKRKISLHFLLHPLSPRLPKDFSIAEKKPKCSLEIMQKPESCRRTEGVLNCLGKSSNLAQCITKGHRIPKLDNDYLDLSSRIEMEVDFKGMPRNNRMQFRAIQQSLTSSFSLIQGPPGTGKTYTGIKLLYLFSKINKIWSQEGNAKNKIIFCGPSNKSVDFVAKWMKRKLGDHAPRMVRMYGSSLEKIDFPIPGKTFSSHIARSESHPDRDLQDVALHWLIRRDDKPHAEKIKQYDKEFRQTAGMSASSLADSEYQKRIRDYTSLVWKASIEELQSYEVIFCTTAMTTNPRFLRGTKGRIYQIIIDECGMCTEPESIATIAATKAKQVVLIGDHKQLRPVVLCQHAADLGLGKSLFERYSERATLLTTQYRMNPRICDFVSEQFYESKLTTAQSSSWMELNPASLWKNPVTPHVFCHVEGHEEYLTVSTEEGNDQSCSNKAEVDKAVEVFIRLLKWEKINPNTVNIMSQYNAQCFAIRKALNEKGFVNSNVNTVVASQGGEWDYVIFSTVRSLPDYKIERRPTLGWCKMNLGFITDQNQINVSLSRARKGLIIIGNKNLLQCNNVWENLLSHYEKRNCVLEASEFPPKRRRRQKIRANRQMSADEMD